MDIFAESEEAPVHLFFKVLLLMDQQLSMEVFYQEAKEFTVVGLVVVFMEAMEELAEEEAELNVITPVRDEAEWVETCLLYTSPSPRDRG